MATTTTTRTHWPRLRLSLGAWMVLVGLVGSIVGLQYRRVPIGVGTAAKVRPVARLDDEGIWQLAWSRDRDRLAVVGWERPVEIRPLALSESGAAEIDTLDWSPDGSVLASGGRAGAITLWDPADLTEIRRLDAPPWVVSIRFSPDGLNLHYAGGSEVMGGPRHLGVLGVEGRLYSLLNRPSATRPGP